MKAEITVLIPTYNRSLYLVEAIRSVFKQTYKRWKLLIIDDASTDDTPKKIKRFLKDPRVKWVRNNTNLGKPKCLNIGLKKTDTPFVIELDDDDLFFSLYS